MIIGRLGKPASLLLSAAAFAMLSSCANIPQTKDEPRGELAANVAVKAVVDASGAATFSYAGDFTDANGNLDFSKEAAGNTVYITFTLAEGSSAGLTFKPEGPDAMWIVDKKNVDPDGSPQGPYQGRQFYGFETSKDGLTFTVTDQNDDGVLYRYGLRFDYNGSTVVDDPDVKNGGSGGHG